jgi:hypothetical protein
VLGQVGLEAEGFIASSAGEQLVLVVSLHVCSQIGPVGKLLPAMSTAKWFLPCMRSHVSLQQPGPGECLPAHITLVTEIVGENVHEESW